MLLSLHPEATKESGSLVRILETVAVLVEKQEGGYPREVLKMLASYVAKSLLQEGL